MKPLSFKWDIDMSENASKLDIALKSTENGGKKNMKRNKIAAVLAASALAMSMTACSTAKKADESAAPETNQAAIVGSWQLSKVLVSETEGENPAEVQEADHASLFGEKENVYTFNEDGTGTFVTVDGPDKMETPVTWKTDDTGSYTVAASDAISSEPETYIYDPAEDVLMREFTGNDPYMHVVTVFARK